MQNKVVFLAQTVTPICFKKRSPIFKSALLSSTITIFLDQTPEAVNCLPYLNVHLHLLLPASRQAVAREGEGGRWIPLGAAEQRYRSYLVILEYPQGSTWPNPKREREAAPTVGGRRNGTCSRGRICPPRRGEPTLAGRTLGGWQLGDAPATPQSPRRREGLQVRRAGPHLHAGAVLEEEEHHALIDAVEPVVHRLVEARGQEGGEQPPGPPGQHVGGSRAQEHGGRQHAAHRVHVEHQGQQHLPGSARGRLRRLFPAPPPPAARRPSVGGQSPGWAGPRRRPLTSPGRRPPLRRPARAGSGLRPQPHGPRRRWTVGGLANEGPGALLPATGQEEDAALGGSRAQDHSHPMTLARHPMPLPGAGFRANNTTPDWPPVTIVPLRGRGSAARTRLPIGRVVLTVDTQLPPGRVDCPLWLLRMLQSLPSPRPLPKGKRRLPGGTG